MTIDLYYRRLMENPFHILGISPDQGGETIRAHIEAGARIHGADLAAWAADQMIDGDARLQAELAWVHDVPRELLDGLLMGISERSLEEIMERCGDLGALDRITIAMDLIASRRPDIGLTPLPWLISGWADFDQAPYLNRINGMRGSAGEVMVDETSFGEGVRILRGSQEAFIAGLIRGGEIVDAELSVAITAFLSDESLILQSNAPSAAPAEEEDTEFAAMAVPEGSEGAGGFGLFEDDPEPEAAPGEDPAYQPQIGEPQDDFLDQDLFSAIAGNRQDEGEEAQDLSASPEEAADEVRRKPRFLAGALAGTFVLALLGGSILLGGNEWPNTGADELSAMPVAPAQLELVESGGAPAPANLTAPSEQDMSAEDIPREPRVAAAEPAAESRNADNHSAPPQVEKPIGSQKLKMRRPPLNNKARMSIAEIRYCHVEFMTLEHLPQFIEGESARRAMLFRALEHVSRCEGGISLQSEKDQVARELRNYDFKADAERSAAKW